MQTQTTYAAVDSTSPQQVTIPVAYSPAPTFGDKLQAEQYEQSRRAQREQQSSEICVAPRCSVTTLSGRVVHAGEPIARQEVGGEIVVRQLEKAGIVIVIDPETAAALSAPPSRYVVGASATITRRGIVPRGAPVSAADFATDAQPEVPARAAHVSATGFAVPEIPGIPARPASDGSAELAELVRRGVVTDSGEPPKGSKR